MELAELLSEYLAGRKYGGFQARLKEIKYQWLAEGLSVDGRFFYLSFKDGKPSIDEFVTFIYHKIIYFCIPDTKIKEYMRKYEETGDMKYFMELSDQAKALFIRAKKQATTTGEPAELILFMLMEAVMEAPQIASKMFLKTSANMPVHGSDGIHVSFNQETNRLKLYWGESKFFQSLSSALDQIVSSIEGFITEDDNGIPKDRDIEIIKDHISIENNLLKTELLKFFDPYEEQSNNLEEIFACFVGFDYTVLGQLDRLDQKLINEQFEEKYAMRIQTACELFADKLKASEKLRKLRFLFFLVPFEKISEVRSKFMRKLGVSDDA